MIKKLLIITYSFLGVIAAADDKPLVILSFNQYSPRLMIYGDVKWLTQNTYKDGKVKQVKVPFTRYYICNYQTRELSKYEVEVILPDVKHFKVVDENDVDANTYKVIKKFPEPVYLDEQSNIACHAMSSHHLHLEKSMEEALKKDEKYARVLTLGYVAAALEVLYFGGTSVISYVRTLWVASKAGRLGSVLLKSAVNSVKDTAVSSLKFTVLTAVVGTVFNEHKNAVNTSSAVNYLVWELKNHQKAWWSPFYMGQDAESTSLKYIQDDLEEKSIWTDNIVGYFYTLRWLLKYNPLQMSRREVRPGYYTLGYVDTFKK